MYLSKPDFFSCPVKGKIKLNIKDMAFTKNEKPHNITERPIPKKISVDSLKLYMKKSEQIQSEALANSEDKNKTGLTHSSSAKGNQSIFNFSLPKQEPIFAKNQRISTSLHHKLGPNIIGINKIHFNKKTFQYFFEEIAQENKKLKKQNNQNPVEIKKQQPPEAPKKRQKNILNQQPSKTKLVPHLAELKLEPSANISDKKYEVRLNFRKSSSTKQFSYRHNVIKKSQKNDIQFIKQFIKTNQLSFEPSHKKASKVFKVNLIKKKNHNAQHQDQFGRWNWQQNSNNWDHEDHENQNPIFYNPNL